MARVSLTIDNGPDSDETPRVLDVLKRRAARASFFVLGQRLAEPAGRRLAERAHAEGHRIGNHTWSHRVPFGAGAGDDAIEREVEATQAEIGALADPERPFRPFGSGGQLDARLLSGALVAHLVERRYSCVLWNAVPRDWERPDDWVPVALEQVAALDWAVLVVHDVLPGNHAQIDRLLGSLGDAGHELVSDLPDVCVPIRCGRLQGTLDGLIGA